MRRSFGEVSGRTLGVKENEKGLPCTRLERGGKPVSPKKRRKVEHTEDFQEILPLCWWPEQEEYELIRPLVLFGGSAPERAVETCCAERTLYEKIRDFDEDGIASLFATEPAKRRVLPLTIRRMILDLKPEYPQFSANEISKICYARSGRMPDRHTVQKVLSEEALQLKANRRFEPYHETSKKEGRTNIVTLHYEGWADKAIAGYLKVDRSTVYRVIRRWIEEGPAGLEDKPRGRPRGVEKVDLRAILTVKEIQENPELGAYRVKAALEQVDIYLGVRTVGRILKMNRETYGFGKPARSPHQKRQMPFEATRRHQIWTGCPLPEDRHTRAALLRIDPRKLQQEDPRQRRQLPPEPGRLSRGPLRSDSKLRRAGDTTD